ncbi:methylamine utilization protein MauE [Candidatus Binatia bacterium]|nr:methylamine utilization protein MauE [Candidatus Binatia bacterium]
MSVAVVGVSLDPILYLGLRAGLVLLFVSAAAHKLRDFESFVAAVDAYDILPRALNRTMAGLLVGAECAIGASLVLWEYSALPVLAAALLLGTYTAAVGVNLRRGRSDLACGCGGPVDAVPIGAGLMGRNLVLICGCLLAALPPSARALTPVDAVTGVGLLATFAFLYAAAETARANAARLRRAGVVERGRP